MYHFYSSSSIVASKYEDALRTSAGWLHYDRLFITTYAICNNELTLLGKFGWLTHKSGDQWFLIEGSGSSRIQIHTCESEDGKKN